MMAVLPLFILSCICLFSGVAVSLEVELILEYETKEYKSTIMECKFNLEGATLGHVAWEKNGEKFFMFNRRRIPPTEVHPVSGVTVDTKKSNMTHVFLTNLKPESSGEYSCTVTTSGGGIQVAIARENMTTSARDPIPLLVGTRKGFFLVTTQNYSAATTWNDAPPILSVGYYFTDGTIFYGGHTGTLIHQDFHESETDSTALPRLGGALILAEEGQVTSIAVDWLQNTLYFTDDMLDNIGKINLTSEARETLLDSNDGVSNPESIAVDPFQRYLFWGNNDERDKKIVASALDGKTSKQTIVSSDLRRAILTLDLERRRLFFIGSDGLSSCKYDGSARRVDFRHPTLDNNVNSLSYYDEFIFWSRYDSGKSSSGLFFARITDPEVAVKELPIKSVLDVKVFHPDLQKRSLQYSCLLLECSDGCAMDASGSAYCTCPPGSTLTAGGTVCTEASTDNKHCEESLTTVSSKPACKGELIFEDNFDSDSLDLSKWQSTVRISSDHDMGFAVFDRHKENIYMKNGNLVIKPTLFDDNTVNTGNISLIGCTTPSKHLCEKQAFSYNIIPPVKSALINTAHSLNFRYGVVTVRAKLPRGDWIYPELNLQATKDFYSPDYRSGVMRIADVRGNKQLTCEEQEAGAKRLMSGVIVGPQQNIKKHFIQKLSDKEWTEDFHTFKFTWTPDKLSFSVDNNPSENILPEGKALLGEGLGISKENVSSRFDSLNQNVYLSVGVGVGGAVEFPDYCFSGSSHHSSREAKPWRNSEVKTLLKFWQKKSSWLPTWGEHSALIVDYISVRAL